MLDSSIEFEYDAAKSSANKEKHGINFNEARALWRDDKRLELSSKRAGENRVLVIGQIGRKHWTAIITYRNDAIRIISVRRSRPKEEKAYETKKKNNLH
jgi:uncharacterized DUF497 family protein